MPNFENSSIYKICSFQTENIYIGSTTQPLSKRMSNHKNKFKNGLFTHSVTEILKYDDAKIILLKLFPCKCKAELDAEERRYIENNINCVNKKLPTRTQNEYRKTTISKNKVKISNKKYKETHKAEIKKINGEWLIKNPNYHKEYNKKRYDTLKNI